jgi:hypothetical protein
LIFESALERAALLATHQEKRTKRNPPRESALFAKSRGRNALLERGVDLGHGGAAIGLALPVEAFLMGAEAGDACLYLGLFRLEFAPEVDPRDRGKL